MSLPDIIDAYLGWVLEIWELYGWWIVVIGLGIIIFVVGWIK